MRTQVRCTGERSGCSRCSNLQSECIYAISRVGKVPGIRARGNRASTQTVHDSGLRSESPSDTHHRLPNSRTPEETGDQDMRDSRRPEVETPNHSRSDPIPEAGPALLSPPSTGLYADLCDANTDKPADAFECADLFILPSQLLASDHEPLQSLHLNHGSQRQSTLDSFHKTTPPASIPALPDLDLHTHDLHQMDLSLSALDNCSTGRRAVGSPSYMHHSTLGFPASTSYAEPVAQLACESDFGRGHSYQNRTILTCNRLVEFLEHRIQRGVVALDVVMHTNKMTLGEISRMLGQGAHREQLNCAMLLLIAVEQIVTLFERSVRQGWAADRGSGEIGARELEEAMPGTGADGGNMLPHLRFGLFQISQDEQRALRSYLLQRELQRCQRVLENLREAIALEPNPCTQLDERVRKLSSAV
ncbi:hypothetical protein CNMCM7691_002264 [Aspergillus felis]|uniref:Zn(2)-C6 fungal-type domain-containing protein n=1 Tax=Aspergillus felis TaxID=1287682 RepID=A0A8H6V5V2_9EURO|nr:hypothetical protein CNMCM7691_002264 [Aspergillus felis]